MIKKLYKILENPNNKKVLKFLKIENSKVYLNNWEASQNSLQDGACQLLNKLTKNIPIENKFAIGTHSIIVIPETGEIIAFNTGLYSLFTKCDFEHFGLENDDSFRTSNTFDCITDIIELGEEWAFIDSLDEEIEDKVTEHYYYKKITSANNCHG